MIAIGIGIIFIVLGTWGVLHWFQNFVVVARGVLPLSFLLGGIVAVMAGINSFQKRRGGDEK